MTSDVPTDHAPLAHRRPCDVCGVSVDPLRAPFAAHVDGAFRYYCARACYDRRLGIAHADAPFNPSARARSVPPGGDRPSIEEVADMLGLARDSLPADVRAGAPLAPVHTATPLTAPRPLAELPPVVDDRVAPAVALGAVALAALWAQADALGTTARIALIAPCALVALLLAVRDAFRMRRYGGVTAWSAGVLASLALWVLGARVSGALLASRLVDATALAALVSVSAWVARVRLRGAQSRLSALAAGLPRSARVVRGAETETVESSRVRAGEEVRVDAGEGVPVDGVVRSGHALAVAHGGGEARAFGEGDAALAGTRVLEGSLRVLAARAGDDVALARLPRVATDVLAAPRSVRIAERLARVMPLAAGAIAVGAAVVHVLGGGEGGTLAIAAVALGAAPCALVASLARVPFADAMALAAGRGIVFRDGASLEAAAMVGTVVLCVRGTVTGGKLEVVDVVSLGPRSERELLATAAAAEESVAREHPIARALTEAARKRDVALDGVRRPALISGRGVTAVNSVGESVAVGSRELLLADGVSVAPAEDVARAIEGQQRTALFVAIAGRVEGVFGLEDPLRDEARGAVQAMMDVGFDLALLAGEARGTVEAIGLALDVANVRPEVLPDERAAAVRAIAEVANAVAVVGRPSRDGAALGAADVAISLAAAGAVGGETAVALASDDLRDVASALSLARRARESARATMAVCVLGALASAAVAGFFPAFGGLGALAYGLIACAAGYAVSGPRAPSATRLPSTQ